MKVSMKRLVAIGLGVVVGVVMNLNPTISHASGNGAGDVVMTLSPANATAAGVYDCEPGGISIEPWQHFSSSGVTRGAGTFCGENSYDSYSVYAWDEASDSGCVAIWVKYVGHSNFTKIAASEACGIGIVRWQLWNMNAYDEIRVVWGVFAAYKVIKT